jgi:hypothetical protein
MMHKSILGAQAWKYQKPTGRIYDKATESRLDFYPAGYSQEYFAKSQTMQGVLMKLNRQLLFKKLYETTETGPKEYPLSSYKVEILLDHEHDNLYDKNAIHLYLNCPELSIVQESLGYVPKVINQLLLKEINRVTDLVVFKVVNDLDDKFFCAKLSMFYDSVRCPNIMFSPSFRALWL